MAQIRLGPRGRRAHVHDPEEVGVAPSAPVAERVAFPRLRASDASHTAESVSVNVGLAVFDDRARVRDVNNLFAALNGLSVEACRGRSARELAFHPIERVDMAVRSVLRTGHSVANIAVRLTDETVTLKPADLDWSIEFHAMPESQRGSRAVLAVLREREKSRGSFADFSPALERTSLLACLASAEGELVHVGSAVLAAAHLTAEDVIGVPVWETPWWSHDAVVQLQIKETLANALADGRSSVETDAQIAGCIVPVEVQALAFRDECGHVTHLTLIVTDLTHRRVFEARQMMLTVELDHRIKNMLSVIQAMIGQTARFATSKEDLVAGLEGRVQAMAEVHNFLMRASAAEVSLRDLVAREIRTIVADPGVCEMVGPLVTLPPRAATSISLVVHELATNAAKYGAFAGPGGHLKVEWQVGARDGDALLNLTWSERSPRPIAPPLRTGFGTHLIAHTVRAEGGHAEFAYAPGGLVCILSLPLNSLQGQG